jgi:hypothetical protein
VREQVGYGALSKLYALLLQLAVYLGTGAVLAIAQMAHAQHHIETEFLTGQRPLAFSFRMIGLVKPAAPVFSAPANLQVQTDQAVARHQFARFGIGRPQRLPADRAGGHGSRQPLFISWFGTGRSSGHGILHNAAFLHSTADAELSLPP